MHTIDMKFAI